MRKRLPFILLLLLLAEYYSFIAVKLAVKYMPAPWRTAIMIIYVLFSITTWAAIILFQQLNWAAMPHLLRNIWVAFVLGFLVGKLLVTAVMLTDDTRRLVFWVIHFFASAPNEKAAAVKGMSRSDFLVRLAIIAGGVSVTGFIYGISNRYNYHVHRLRLSLSNIPEAFKGFKIVQISDIHTGSFDNHEAVINGIKKVLKEKPDVILFTGDLVNNHAHEVDEHYQQIFGMLSAPHGIYSTLGNHDYGDYAQWPSVDEKYKNLETLKNIQAKMGWRLLMNEHVILERGADKIALIGIENWSAKANFPKYGDMAKAYAGLSEKNIPFKILMSHDPSHWDAQVRTEYPDVDLTLSGHTHGMQFGIENKWLKWSPIKYMYKEWAGLYKEGDQHLYVNRGFGFLGYPGRLGILPEITVIELA